MNCMRFILLTAITSLTLYSASAQAEYGDYFNEITGYLKDKYVDDVNIDSVVNTMIYAYLNDPATLNALFQKLDPHSNYLNAEEYGWLKEGLAGTFYGVGMRFTMHHDTALVVEVFKNGPAEKGGLKTGDRLVKINDSLVAGTGLNEDDLMYLMRGPKDTEVNVAVIRGQTRQFVSLTFVRDRILIPSVEVAYMVDKQTGYLKLSRFGETTYDECVQALTDLKNQGMKQLILDLRGNTGGYLKSAVRIADEFLPAGQLVVYTQGSKQARYDYRTEKEGQFEKGDMVVLADRETASSGEILTGALQDNKRAVVIGTRTYGKGLVQEIFRLSDSITALKLTTARYYTPSGRCIQRPYTDGSDTYFDEYETVSFHTGAMPESYKNAEWGIHPDIFVADDTLGSSLLVNAFSARNYIAPVAYVYYADHQSDFSGFTDARTFAAAYQVSDALFQLLKTSIAEKETSLKADERIAYTDADLVAARESLEIMLKANLAFERWGNEGMRIVLNTTDKDMAAAMSHFKK